MLNFLGFLAVLSNCKYSTFVGIIRGQTHTNIDKVSC